MAEMISKLKNGYFSIIVDDVRLRNMYLLREKVRIVGPHILQKGFGVVEFGDFILQRLMICGFYLLKNWKCWLSNG